MKAYIVFIKKHIESETQAKEALASFKEHGWDARLIEGLTPKTVEETEEFSEYSIVENSRLLNFKTENYNRFLSKVSCAINQIRHWKRVVQADEPIAFIEHDAICISQWNNVELEDYLILNAAYAFKPPNKLGLQKFKNFKAFEYFTNGPEDLPPTYPLKYYRDNLWKDSFMAPGTGAYIISPSGAKKMLNAVETHGIDQSDFMINSKNLRIQYINPSPVKFNKVNLSTSYGF